MAARDELQSRTKLWSLCEMRWSARSNSLATFKAADTSVCNSLEDLEENHNDQKLPHCHHKVWLHSMPGCHSIIEYILSAVAPLPLFLQKESDLIAASKEASAIVVTLTSERGNDAVWQVLCEQAVASWNLSKSLDWQFVLRIANVPAKTEWQDSSFWDCECGVS